MLCIAAFVAAYIPFHGVGLQPSCGLFRVSENRERSTHQLPTTDPMFTIVPDFLATMCGSTACTRRRIENVFASNAFCTVSRGTSKRAPVEDESALLSTILYAVKRTCAVRAGIIDKDVNAMLSVDDSLDDVSYAVVAGHVEYEFFDSWIAEAVHGFESPGCGVNFTAMSCIFFASGDDVFIISDEIDLAIR